METKKFVKPADIAPITVQSKSAIPVHQFGLDGKYIATFPSMAEASKASGAKMNSIAQCLKGELRQTGGFQFRKAE